MTISTTALARPAAGILAITLLAACSKDVVQAPPPGTVTVHAAVETQPISGPDDAADDAAIWVNAEDPADSLVLGTDKKSGLYVYDLSGRVHQYLPEGNLNNVDLRDGVTLGGRDVVLIAASNRSRNAVTLFTLDPETRRVSPTGVELPSGLREVYGFCLYRNAETNAISAIVNDKTGAFEQWAIRSENGRLDGDVARRFSVDSQPEGCVADDEAGVLYVGEEGRGIWKLSAEATAPADLTLVDDVAHGRLVADVEGLTLYATSDGGGYLIASSQGSNSYTVYERQGDNAHVGSFRIGDDPTTGIDGTEETDGIAATSASLGTRFPDGAFVAQDGLNHPGPSQNFKIVPWERIENALGRQGVAGQ